MHRRLIASIVLCAFSVTFVLMPSISFAAPTFTPLSLPAPGSMVNLTSAYVPVIAKGLRIHPDNPVLFDFIIDTGNSGLGIRNGRDRSLRYESTKLIKYFLAALTIPDDDQWVNLSPYEKDRIIPDQLGQTEMGRDMLAQDYILKQITASLIYPEKELGREFWNKVYAKAQALYGSNEVPVNTFNKVWIVADKAKIYVHDNTAFVVGSHLKVMLEEDYVAMNKGLMKQTRTPTNNLGSQIIREIVLPALENEINQGKNFATLRQIFHSMILASWYKKNLKEALLNQIYSNKSKINGISVTDKTIKDQIYQQYLKAYKKGVFNYIKEDIDQGAKQTVPRKYFSGGLRLLGANYAMQTVDVHNFPTTAVASTGNFILAEIGMEGSASAIENRVTGTTNAGMLTATDLGLRLGSSDLQPHHNGAYIVAVRSILQNIINIHKGKVLNPIPIDEDKKATVLFLDDHLLGTGDLEGFMETYSLERSESDPKKIMFSANSGEFDSGIQVLLTKMEENLADININYDESGNYKPISLNEADPKYYVIRALHSYRNTHYTSHLIAAQYVWEHQDDFSAHQVEEAGNIILWFAKEKNALAWQIRFDHYQDLLMGHNIEQDFKSCFNISDKGIPSARRGMVMIRLILKHKEIFKKFREDLVTWAEDVIVMKLTGLSLPRPPDDRRGPRRIRPTLIPSQDSIEFLMANAIAIENAENSKFTELQERARVNLGSYLRRNNQSKREEFFQDMWDVREIIAGNWGGLEQSGSSGDWLKHVASSLENYGDAKRKNLESRLKAAIVRLEMDNRAMRVAEVNKATFSKSSSTGGVRSADELDALPWINKALKDKDKLIQLKAASIVAKNPEKFISDQRDRAKALVTTLIQSKSYRERVLALEICLAAPEFMKISNKTIFDIKERDQFIGLPGILLSRAVLRYSHRISGKWILSEWTEWAERALLKGRDAFPKQSYQYLLAQAVIVVKDSSNPILQKERARAVRELKRYVGLNSKADPDNLFEFHKTVMDDWNELKPNGVSDANQWIRELVERLERTAEDNEDYLINKLSSISLRLDYPQAFKTKPISISRKVKPVVEPVITEPVVQPILQTPEVVLPMAETSAVPVPAAPVVVEPTLSEVAVARAGSLKDKSSELLKKALAMEVVKPPRKPRRVSAPVPVSALSLFSGLEDEFIALPPADRQLLTKWGGMVEGVAEPEGPKKDLPDNSGIQGAYKLWLNQMHAKALAARSFQQRSSSSPIPVDVPVSDLTASSLLSGVIVRPLLPWSGTESALEPAEIPAIVHSIAPETVVMEEAIPIPGVDKEIPVEEENTFVSSSPVKPQVVSLPVQEPIKPIARERLREFGAERDAQKRLEERLRSEQAYAREVEESKALSEKDMAKAARLRRQLAARFPNGVPWNIDTLTEEGEVSPTLEELPRAAEVLSDHVLVDEQVAAIPEKEDTSPANPSPIPVEEMGPEESGKAVGLSAEETPSVTVAPALEEETINPVLKEAPKVLEGAAAENSGELLEETYAIPSEERASVKVMKHTPTRISAKDIRAQVEKIFLEKKVTDNLFRLSVIKLMANHYELFKDSPVLSKAREFIGHILTLDNQSLARTLAIEICLINPDFMGDSYPVSIDDKFSDSLTLFAQVILARAILKYPQRFQESAQWKSWAEEILLDVLEQKKRILNEQESTLYLTVAMAILENSASPEFERYQEEFFEGLNEFLEKRTSLRYYGKMILLNEIVKNNWGRWTISQNGKSYKDWVKELVRNIEQADLNNNLDNLIGVLDERLRHPEIFLIEEEGASQKGDSIGIDASKVIITSIPPAKPSKQWVEGSGTRPVLQKSLKEVLTVGRAPTRAQIENLYDTTTDSVQRLKIIEYVAGHDVQFASSRILGPLKSVIKALISQKAPNLETVLAYKICLMHPGFIEIKGGIVIDIPLIGLKDIPAIILAKAVLENKERICIDQKMQIFQWANRRYEYARTKQSVLLQEVSNIEKPINAAMNAPGGIDLNDKNLQWDIQGQKIKIAFDPAMVAQFKRGDFSGIHPVIINLTPIPNILPWLGLKEDEAGLVQA